MSCKSLLFQQSAARDGGQWRGALHIDGKTLRRSLDGASEKAALQLHMVSVWASKAELALGHHLHKLGEDKETLRASAGSGWGRAL
jgi:hypothetical protein